MALTYEIQILLVCHFESYFRTVFNQTNWKYRFKTVVKITQEFVILTILYFVAYYCSSIYAEHWQSILVE